MQNNNKNDRLAQDIVRASNGKIDPDAAKQAASGDVSKLVESLNPQDRAKLNALLSDEKATKQLLSSDAAKIMLKMLFVK